MGRNAKLLTTALLITAFLAGCAGPGPAKSRTDYDPALSAADFVRGVDNPFLPLQPGAFWIYEAANDDEVERIEVRVLNETRMIQGVEAVIVRDTVSVNGALVEDTFDWYAQDRTGNVWYLGEDTSEYEGGVVVSTVGSWEWGVNGGLPGVTMWADPTPNGTAYFQEFLWGEAVDEAAVIALGRTIETPAGSFSDTVTTKEWTRLHPGVEENAHYARGVGPVMKEQTLGAGAGQKEVLVEYGRVGASG
jgi:hypothetical protein